MGKADAEDCQEVEDADGHDDDEENVFVPDELIFFNIFDGDGLDKVEHHAQGLDVYQKFCQDKGRDWGQPASNAG